MKEQQRPWEEKMMELMMQYSFDELSDEDKAWVLLYLPKNEYVLQQACYQQLNDKEDWQLEEEEVLSPSLILPVTGAVVWYKRPIPLYHLGWVAAACLLFFFLWMNPNKTETALSENLLVNTVIDTVYQQDTIWVEKWQYDTVVEKQIEYVTLIEPTYEMDCEQEPPRLLEVNNSPVFVPGLASAQLETPGKSLKTDPTASLIDDYLNVSNSSVD